ncbi:MAG: DUF4493 domain-containing protein [Bacteroides sp.]
MRYIAERCFTLLCCLCLLTACMHESGTDGIPTTGSGFLLSLSDLSIQTNGSADTRTLPSELEKPVAANFQVTILPEGATQPLYEGPFTSDPIPAGAGRYTLKARCGTNPTLAWDTPYYEGSTEATVPQNGYTPVTIPCRVANALLSVRFSNPELFSQLYSDYSVSITHDNYTLSISPKNNSQSAYFPAGSVPSVSFTATLLSNGNKVSFNMDNDLTNVLPLEEGKHAILTLTASNTAFTIEKIEVVDASIDATVPDNWLPCPKVSGFGSINYVETNDAPTGAVISYTASRPIQAMELTFHFEDPQYASLSDKPFKLHELTEEERTQLAQIGITNFPQFGVDKEGSFDFAPLIATLQTNAGTTTVNTISLRLKANDRWSDEKATTSHQVKVEKPEFGVNVMPEKVWSKEFTVEEITVTSGNANRIKTNLKYQYSADDGNTWTDCSNGTLHKFATHPSEKNYKIRALYRQAIASQISDLILETPTQLPNSGMEEWHTANTSWEFYNYLPWTTDGQELWNTNNEFTLRYTVPATPYNGFPAVSYSYEHHEGNRSAELRNTAAGPVGTSFSIFDANKVAGMLFLGDYTGTTSTATANGSITIDEGRPFPVRPTHLSFWFTYAPYNSDGADSFEALIKVIDANGTVIGSGIFTSNKKVDFWTQQTIVISYISEVVSKAAKIYVFFQSSNAGQGNVPYGKKRKVTLADDKTYTTHYGSVLRIDDLYLTFDR